MKTCPICYKNSQIQRTFECSHNVCYDCFPKLLVTSNACPMCRHLIFSTEKYEWFQSNGHSTFDNLMKLSIIEADDPIQVKMCLDNGARLTKEEFIDDPIKLSVCSDRVKVFQLFLQMGKNPHRDKLFILAAENGKNEIVKYMLKLNVNVFENNSAAITLAANGGHLATIELILDHVINRKHTDTPMNITRESDNEIFYSEVLELAIDLEMMDLVAKILKMNVTLEHRDYMLRATEVGNLDMINLLINYDIVPLDPDLLYYNMVMLGHYRGVIHAIDHGADINYTNPLTNESALLHSFMDENLDIAKLLITGGAETSNVFEYAFDILDESLLKFLIECGAKPSKQVIDNFRQRKEKISRMGITLEKRKIILPRQCKGARPLIPPRWQN